MLITSEMIGDMRRARVQTMRFINQSINQSLFALSHILPGILVVRITSLDFVIFVSVTPIILNGKSLSFK